MQLFLAFNIYTVCLHICTLTVETHPTIIIICMYLHNLWEPSQQNNYTSSLQNIALHTKTAITDNSLSFTNSSVHPSLTCLWRQVRRLLTSTSSVRTKFLIWLSSVVWGEEPTILSLSHLNFRLLAISRLTCSQPDS